MTRVSNGQTATLPGRGAGSATVYQAFRDSVQRSPERDFLTILPETAGHYGIAARSHSYSQAAAEVETLKARYTAAGLGAGQRAGLLLENRPAMFFHWLALNALGVSVVPINPDWRSAELEYLVAHSEICVAVAPEGRLPGLAMAARDAHRGLVVTTADLDTLVPVAAPAAPEEPGISTECALLYTSGTTGRPKGCVLTNAYYLEAGAWYQRVGGLCALRPGQDRLLTPLPMSHMNAMAFSTMAMLLSGGCLVPLDRFHPATWWQSVRDSQATIVHYLGVMPAMLLGAPISRSDQSHQVRFGFGAGVSPALHGQFESRFGFPLLEAWAMTETGAGAVVIANREPRKTGTACFGRAPESLDYRIVDEQGTQVPSGTHGELWVRCRGGDPRAGFFQEYLKDPQATAAAWQGGFFHTGDVIFEDDEGDLHFVDRKKNVIRRSGENISAVEVEGVLQQHPQVAAVGVTAVPDAIRGDEVLACVVPRAELGAAEREALARELLHFCLQRLAYFKAPGYVAFCSGLPRTATEKIQRAQLRELANELMRTGSSIDLRALKKRPFAA